jgi:sugar phosphate isomerase/epimerase
MGFRRPRGRSSSCRQTASTKFQASLGPAEDLCRALTAHGLTLVGLAGGSLPEKVEDITHYTFAALRIGLAARSGPPASRGNHPYVYVDEWENGRSEAALGGCTLALHPHIFKPVQTVAEAERLLDRYPALRFLPDTAHPTVAGEDVVAVIARHFDRIDAVHLKDWTAEYGRAYQFYSRGFVELGAGDVLPELVMDLLKERRFRGWLVVEQDAADNPDASALQSREWLRKQCGI